jgi:acetylornithine/succinyldiaminopimelate/putrescine aminotransferase
MGVEIVRAEGAYLYDARGRTYLDAVSGICVNNLGHRHPAVMAAIQRQLDKFTHAMVYGELILESQVELATRLASLLPENLSVSYLVNSGTEAVEGALKLARRFTGRSQIVSFENCYHGSTMGALSLSSSKERRSGFGPLLGDVCHLPFNGVEQLEQVTQQTACVIVEPIQGEAGIIEATVGFLSALRTRCSEVGALLIFDEVQTGFGRTGKMFCFEHYGSASPPTPLPRRGEQESKVVPDILLVGKAIANGLPLAAFISSSEIMSCLKHPPLGHMTTFGGNPVACASALAVLDVMSEPGFLDHVNAMGELIKRELRHPAIREIRGRGLMFAVQLESEKILRSVFKRCLENGVVTDWFLFAPHSLRICPPLTISENEVIQLCSRLDDLFRDRPSNKSVEV